MIQIKENNNKVEEFNELYDAVGWGHYEENISQRALDNTYYSVSVYEDGKIIGYGRMIGDTIIFMYIQDIMVRPEYQNKKIGTMIMSKLLEKVKELRKTNPDILVYLGASKNKEPFYERFGFVDRKAVDLGAGMILKDKEE